MKRTPERQIGREVEGEKGGGTDRERYLGRKGEGEG